MITIQDLFWLIPSASVLALIFAAVFFYRMKAQDEGNEVMKMIAKHVRSGAMAYLRQQYKIVTIFFVLSGYLITRLLLNEVAKTGRIDLKSFWIRRIRRLVPAVVTVVVVTCALCTLFNHVMLTKMRPDILPSLLFFNNWWQIAQNVSYFNALGDPSPLTHFWSLAIEEQFYLIWPPLLFAMVSMHVSKPNTRRVVLGLAVVSALAMMVLYNPVADPSRVYYGTDTLSLIHI